MIERTFDVFGRPLAALTSHNVGGPRLLALHGWLDNAASFLPLASRLPGFEIVALDMAGHGRSAHRSADGEYNIWSDLPDIEAVADSLGWDSFNLVGHSRGAVVSCLFASSLPQRVERLVLLDGLPAQSVEPADCTAQLADFLRDKKRLLDRPGRVFSRIEDAVAVRERGGLSTAAARLIVERNLKPVDGGWCWSHDARLQGASAFKLTAAHNRAVMAGLSMPGLLLLAEEGVHRERDGLPSRPGTLTVEHVPGGHHGHMEGSATLIAGRIREFLTPKEGA
jgi:pimeloyl-ACP methyl ester carboxylesterase